MLLTQRSLKLFFFISLFYGAQAQAQVTEWISPEEYGAYGIAVDEFDNSYTISQYTNSINVGGIFPFTSEGLQDEVIIKHDPAGNVVWATSIGGAQSDWAGDITYDNVGNVWVTGQFSGTFNAGSYSLLTNGSEDAYLVKLDAATGTVLYASNGGGSSANDDGNDIGADAMGNIYLTGDCASSNWDWGGFGMSVSGINDVFVMKFDNSGTPLWLSTIQGTGWEFTYCMAVDDAGNSYIGGQTSSASTDYAGTVLANGTNDHFITKIDANGNHVWSALCEYGGNMEGVAVDDNQNVYFTSGGGPGTFGGVTIASGNGSGDILIGKINSNGTFSWAQLFGGTANDTGYSVDCDEHGNVILAGSFQNTMTVGSFNLSSNSLNKGMVAKLDSAGTVQWALASKGGVGSHYFQCVQATHNNDIFVTGSGGDHIVFANDSIALTSGYSIRIADSANVIQGVVYADDSNDGIKDAGELGIPNVIVQLDGSNFVAASNNQGEYQVYTPSGSHTVSIPYPPIYHTLTTPVTQSATFTGMGNIDTANHFGLYPTPGMNDLRVDITPITNPKAGYVLGYLIYYKNVGTTTLSPVVTLQSDANLSYLYSVPVEDSQAGTTTTWNIGSLGPQAVGTINVYFNIPSSMQIGDPLSSTVTIDPTTGDEVPADNTHGTTSLVVGPYDPNYKRVDIDTLYDLAGASYLEYDIHFQNLGNAPAQNVLVVDTLTTNYLEMASIEIVSTSHLPMNLSIDNGNIAKFNFPGIMLPDSISDPLGSIGFVKFRIKQNGTLPVNSTIENFADIYFDYNPAIRTDTAKTIHIVGASLDELDQTVLSVYPNPTNGEVTVVLDDSSPIEYVEIIDLTGRVVRRVDVYAEVSMIDVNLFGLTPGMYFISLKTKTATSTIKVQLK